MYKRFPKQTCKLKNLATLDKQYEKYGKLGKVLRTSAIYCDRNSVSRRRHYFLSH